MKEILTYEGPKTVAAIFIETVTGTNGLIVPPDGYLQGLREICDRHGIMLVCDEVMCGLGRTGRWFATDHWNVVPDMITMAKGLTSAYLPLGAVAISDRTASYFDRNIFYGGLTYSAHPMSLAAAEACTGDDRRRHHGPHAAHGPRALLNWNNLFTNPPLCINEEQLRDAFGVIDRALEITDAAVVG